MDIKESKEYRLAKDWEMAVNSFSFNPERFAAAIPDMHPTLQQSLYRLIKACIKVMADETRRYDDRNRASHEEAKHIMEYLNEHGKNVPLIVIVKTCSDSLFSIGQKNCQLFVAKLRNFLDSHNRMVLY